MGAVGGRKATQKEQAEAHATAEAAFRDLTATSDAVRQAAKSSVRAVLYQNPDDIENPNQLLLYRTYADKLPTLLAYLQKKITGRNNNRVTIDSFPVFDEKGALSCQSHRVAITSARQLHPPVEQETDFLNTYSPAKRAVEEERIRASMRRDNALRLRAIESDADYIRRFLAEGTGRQGVNLLNLSNLGESANMPHMRYTLEHSPAKPESRQLPAHCRTADSGK